MKRLRKYSTFSIKHLEISAPLAWKVNRNYCQHSLFSLNTYPLQYRKHPPSFLLKVTTFLILLSAFCWKTTCKERNPWTNSLYFKGTCKREFADILDPFRITQKLFFLRTIVVKRHLAPRKFPKGSTMHPSMAPSHSAAFRFMSQKQLSSFTCVSVNMITFILNKVKAYRMRNMTTIANLFCIEPLKSQRPWCQTETSNTINQSVTDSSILPARLCQSKTAWGDIWWNQ